MPEPIRPITIREYLDRYREVLASIAVEDPLQPLTMEDIGKVAYLSQQFHLSIAARVTDAPPHLKAAAAAVRPT